ncbi:hypothetical protein M408DRAFT_330823 [Serendipita vermifera MAFF 305830]|uniref:Uncharacterized protein n=1 Tax=Serendipita vermifera MAFF 305830 TaxID=933852 RepID=A0A0C3AN99_SERVB|nr:hypothetical protein M408DRAFT_330823 [Serendipita vermifera MAFF 305830]
MTLNYGTSSHQTIFRLLLMPVASRIPSRPVFPKIADYCPSRAQCRHTCPTYEPNPFLAGGSKQARILDMPYPPKKVMGNKLVQSFVEIAVGYGLVASGGVKQTTPIHHSLPSC